MKDDIDPESGKPIIGIDLLKMKKLIVEKSKYNKARMMSGDVFPCLSKENKHEIDIIDGPFEAQWNTRNDFSSNPVCIDEVGCIHTVQGMEFEYAGLIIADDLRYENGKIIMDHTKHHDSATEFKRPSKRKVRDEDIPIIDQLIRNTYRVLLTRGQKGVFLYVMDEPLRNFIKAKLLELQSPTL